MIRERFIKVKMAGKYWPQEYVGYTDNWSYAVSRCMPTVREERLLDKIYDLLIKKDNENQRARELAAMQRDIFLDGYMYD